MRKNAIGKALLSRLVPLHSDASMTALHHLLDQSAAVHCDRIAAVDSSGVATDYGRLARLSDRVRDRLAAMGVVRGDRVGIYLRKSTDSLAVILGILKCGAAYVPVDVNAPGSRNAFIHNNCHVKAVVLERQYEEAYFQEMAGVSDALPRQLVLDSVGGATQLQAALGRLDALSTAPRAEAVNSSPDDLAYILYTSGSTGVPKGVPLTHRNAVSFVNWCSNVFDPTPNDVFSSHAPFHFDLSILDLFVPMKHGASVVIIGERDSKEPLSLSRIICEQQISIWYSTPSILNLIAQFGRVAEHDLSSLRLVLFAGEVFPIVQLRALKEQIPQPRYFNLYGPTETNVCTYFEVPQVIDRSRTAPYPIGKVCEQLAARVVDSADSIVPKGGEGELLISGPNVMNGYWALPEQTSKAFWCNPATGEAWYRTGDIVAEDSEGNFVYVGRRDRMVKRRGYRVELGEIEACLYLHDGIRDAAVVALSDESGAVRIKAHVTSHNARPLSQIELKTFCSKHLPLYMIPDAFAFHSALPRTSTDKTDYQSLKQLG